MSEKQLEDMGLDELREHVSAIQPEPEVKATDEEPQQEAKAESKALDDDGGAEVETLEQIKARLESAEKALRDTKAWGTRKAQEAAELRKAQEEAIRAASKPAILEQNPDLEDAFRYVQHSDAQKQQYEREIATRQWQDTVRTAVPDVDDLLENPDFYAAIEKRAEGVDWSNPIIAIRELQAEIRERAVIAAKRSADNEKAEKKRSATSVPTSGARQSISAKSDDEELLSKFKTMSSADFAKEVRRVSLGQ